MQLLLIEPNRQLARTYRQALEQAGHTVSWQQMAQAAVGAMDSQIPDAIILELQLAGHGGIEFLYESRSYTDWQNVPVIVHTFVPEESLVLQRHHLQTLGVVSYLYKPAVTLQQLIRVVNELPAVVA